MLKIGHRGAAAHVAENTIASFRKALELGANAIELDIHTCATGEPIIIHDPTLERTTNGRGAVKNFSLQQIQTFKTTIGEAPPTLEAALNAIGPKCRWFIELKSPESAKAVATLLKKQAQKPGWSYAYFIVIGFDHAWLKEVKEHDPGIPVGASFDSIPADFITRALTLKAAAILPRFGNLKAAHVEEAHRHHLEVHPWTANLPADIARLKTLGVDGIIGDYPERL